MSTMETGQAESGDMSVCNSMAEPSSCPADVLIVVRATPTMSESYRTARYAEKSRKIGQKKSQKRFRGIGGGKLQREEE